MIDGLPYRAPCGGWPDPKVFMLGPPYQHYRDEDSKIPLVENVTTVPDLNDKGIATPPFERIDCVIEDLSTAPNPPGPCGPRPPLPCHDGMVKFYDNCYLPAQTKTINRAKCRKIGFKVLRGTKNWHGADGYLYNDGCCEPEPVRPDRCCHEPIKGTPTQTRYLSQVWNVSLSGSFVDPVTGDSGDLGGTSFRSTVSVDRYSGKITASVSGSLTVTGGMAGVFSSDDLLYNVNCNGGWINGNATVTGILNGTLSVGDDPYLSIDDEVVGVTVNSKKVSNTEISFDITFNAIEHQANDDRLTIYLKFSSTLSDPYSASDVEADLNSAIKEWPMTDDVIYPWREDGNMGMAPLVGYNERTRSVPSLITDLSYHDPSLPIRPNIQDGDVLGRPLPRGYYRYWDGWHQNCQDVDDGMGGTLCEIVSWGAWSPEWCPNATLWTDTCIGDIHCSPPPNTGGAYSQWDTQSNTLTKQVWAEIITFTKPSHNYARPCGTIDHATLDQTKIDCGTDTPGPSGYDHFPLVYPGDARWHDPHAPCYCNNPSQAENGGGTCDANAAPSAINQWNDNQKKGDFIYREWIYDQRDWREVDRIIAEYAARQALITEMTGSDPPPCSNLQSPPAAIRTKNSVCGLDRSLKDVRCSQMCAQFSVCHPVFVLMSIEKPPFPVDGMIFKPTLKSLPADSRYGSTWRANILQWMTDPLWQTPARPCDCTDDGDLTPGTGTPDGCIPHTVQWKEDNGRCLTAGYEVQGESIVEVFYYPIRPYEEARCCEPPGAPAVRGASRFCSDFIHLLDIETINSGNCSLYSDLWPDGGNQTPWVTQLIQEAYCCSLFQDDCAASPPPDTFSPP